MSRHSDWSSLISGTDSEVLSTLTSHGQSTFQPGRTAYVIHTHSVPLASAVDLHYLLEGNSRTLFHGYEVGNSGDCCPKRSCMYITSTGHRRSEKVPANCPCKKVLGIDGEPLKPRCFLTYVRSLGRHLASETDGAPVMDPASIMFCQTHVGIFDNSYPGWLRDNLGVSGWNHVSPGLLLPALRTLYWYRSYAKILNLDKLIDKGHERVGFRQLRHGITQAIHTLNGVLIKKFMAFCPESTRYQDYAKQTAYLFRDLLSDYLHPLVYRDGRLSEPEGLTYSELKEFLSSVKRSFHRFTPEARGEWLEFEFKSKSLRRMFNEIPRVKALVESKANVGSDYTESPAWFFRCSTLCQTRVLGYLPSAIAEVKRKQFRNAISRPLERPPKENIQLIMKAVDAELAYGKIPREFMLKDPIWKDAEKSMRFNEAISAIELPLKGSASVHTLVRDGGKIEDARQLLQLAQEHKWRIPVRDLHDHEVLNTFEVSVTDESSISDYTRPLFWLSYTIILNHFTVKGFFPKQLYYPLRLRVGTYDPDPMLASIVHISEPGKERNLTKSTGFLAWFLTPASKITQDTLAVLPEHEAGLIASSHEWRHQKRISSLSKESMFLYDPVTGKTRSNIVHAFKDWTESTDFIGKMVGWAHLKTLLKYIGFPEGYMRLLGISIVEPQPVTEVVALRNFDDEDLEIDPIPWKGQINEGFMMGNPMTKTILHLIHVSERNVIRAVLKRMGATEGPRAPYRGLGDPVRLGREVVTGVSSPQTLWS